MKQIELELKYGEFQMDLFTEVHPDHELIILRNIATGMGFVTETYISDEYTALTIVKQNNEDK